MAICPNCHNQTKQIESLSYCQRCGTLIVSEALRQSITPNLVTEVLGVYRQIGDDNCWLDIDLIFKAMGLLVPDRTVGDKCAMLENCRRYIETMCSGGQWKSYAELMEENRVLKEKLAS